MLESEKKDIDSLDIDELVNELIENERKLTLIEFELKEGNTSELLEKFDYIRNKIIEKCRD